MDSFRIVVGLIGIVVSVVGLVLLPDDLRQPERKAFRLFFGSVILINGAGLALV